MALKGVKGPDRVLYGLAGLLQNKLPAAIAAYNDSHKAITLFTVPGGEITLAEALSFQYSIGGVTHVIPFLAGTYTLGAIKAVINNAENSLSAIDFGHNALLLECASSVQFLTTFGNIKAGQIVNYQPLAMPNSIIISGKLPSEDSIEAYPSMVIELSSISPEDDTILTTYGVDLTIGVTSPLNSSQVDFLSGQLLKYYDVIFDVITTADDGSLGGLINGVSILSAAIDEATGNSYFLKFLTISLNCIAEED